MPGQIIQLTAFAQIIDIWRPGRSLEYHLKATIPGKLGISAPSNGMLFHCHIQMHTAMKQHYIGGS